MAIFRREYDEEKGIATYHCDEHGFKASDPAHVEEHLKQHGRSAASFWKKRHDHEKNITVYHCVDHGFESYDPREIEEHERSHALLMGAGWGIL